MGRTKIREKKLTVFESQFREDVKTFRDHSNRIDQALRDYVPTSQSYCPHHRRSLKHLQLISSYLAQHWYVHDQNAK